jgi:glycosyltransferase involved in cell wall biosynthesis
MVKGKKIGVVVPAFNEEKQIGMVLDTMPDFVDVIIVIDDASRDRTCSMVESRRPQLEKIVLLRHEKNRGVGAAIATGYKWARDNGLDIAVVMAGDGQMDPKDLPDIIAPVVDGEVDYAKGNRLFSGAAFQKMPKIRYIGNSILSLLTKIASGYWHIADSQSGYTAINRNALRAIDWDRMYKRYGQPNDLLVLLNVHDFKVRDVHINPTYHIGEKSAVKIYKVIFTLSWLLLKRFIWRMKEKYVIRDFHPLVFFYALGGLMTVAFAFFCVRLILLWIKIGHVPEITAFAMAFCFATGLQSTFFAMWFDMEKNKDLR